MAHGGLIIKCSLAFSCLGTPVSLAAPGLWGGGVGSHLKNIDMSTKKTGGQNWQYKGHLFIVWGWSRAERHLFLFHWGHDHWVTHNFDTLSMSMSDSDDHGSAARIDLGFANKVEWVGKFINIDSTKNAMTTHFHLQPLSGHYPLSSFDAIAFYTSWLCVQSVPFLIMLVSSSTCSCLLCLSMQTSLSIYLPFYPIKWLFPIHL